MPTKKELYQLTREITEEIEPLDKIHQKCRYFLDQHDYLNFRKFVRFFINENTDANILKTILIITRPFKKHASLKKTREKIKEIFDKQMK